MLDLIPCILKFMQFVLADGCVVFVWVSVELLGACHLDLCFPGSFSMFHVKRKFGGCGMWEEFHVEHLSYLEAYSGVGKTCLH